MTWILIIMLAGSHGHAIASVPGFETKAACEMALETVRKEWPNSVPSYTQSNALVCVHQ